MRCLTPLPRCVHNQLVSFPPVRILNSLCSIRYISLFIYGVPNWHNSAKYIQHLNKVIYYFILFIVFFCSSSARVLVKLTLKRTVAGDKCFDNVCGSNLQFCRHVIGCKTRVKFLTSQVSLIASFDTSIVARSTSRSRLSGVFSKFINERSAEADPWGNFVYLA